MRRIEDPRLLKGAGRYTDDLTAILLGEPETLSADDRAALAAMQVAVLETSADRVRVEGDRILCFADATGKAHSFDTVYSAMGTVPRNGLARQLGAALNDTGCMVVDEHGRTSAPGVWAAGDVVRGLNQINVAMGEAAIAATDIHNHLRR